MEALGLDRIDYLKIDCEGSEYEILENFEDYHKISLIALEMHDFYGKKRKLGLLKKLFKYYHIVTPTKVGRFSLEHLIVEAPSLKDLQDQHLFFLVNKALSESKP